jgi:hypothetical protein
MKNPLRLAGALTALLAGTIALGVHAATEHPRLGDPATPEAPVPATRYESRELTTLRIGSTPSPSQNWRALNQVVASYDSMSPTMEIADALPAKGAITGAAAVAVSTPSSAHGPHQPAAQHVVTDAHAHHKPGAK